MDLAMEYGLSDKTIYRWLEKRAQGNDAEQLRLVGQLTYEQELKK